MHSLFQTLLAPLLMTAVSVVSAQPQGNETAANLSYTLSSANDDYIGHTLSGRVRLGVLPLTASLVVAQGKVDDAEVMNMYDLGLGWHVTKLWTVKTHMSRMQLEKVEIQGKGLSVAVNLHTLWQGKRRTQLEWGVDQNDYVARSGNALANEKLPTQKRVMFELRQGLSDDFSVYASTEQYSYDRELSLVGAVLLNAYLRRTNADIAMGGMLQRVNTYRINWHPQQKWTFDLSYRENWSVLQQRSYGSLATASYDLTSKGSIAFGFGEAKTAKLLRPNGKLLVDEQINSTMELGVRWLFD